MAAPLTADPPFPEVDTFAVRLREFRNRRTDLTQEQAATLCNLNPKTWATWEQGTEPQKKDQKVQQIVNGLGDYLGLAEDRRRELRDWLMWGALRSR